MNCEAFLNIRYLGHVVPISHQEAFEPEFMRWFSFHSVDSVRTDEPRKMASIFRQLARVEEKSYPDVALAALAKAQELHATTEGARALKRLSKLIGPEPPIRPAPPKFLTSRLCALVASAPEPTPFLKWAGGKSKLVSEIHARMQLGGVYHEPFLGGGAVFFRTLPAMAALSDSNDRLVRTYIAVRDRVEAVIELLSGYPNDAKFFEKMRRRSTQIDRADDVTVAAWFIYLNKTAFNGLYRVNKRNEFNVPFGNYPNPTICDADNLRACSRALRDTVIRCLPFELALSDASDGDFVYCDPPYAPMSATSSFTGYTHAGFDADDQRRLRDAALDLKVRGVRVLISNSAAAEIVELYRGDFTVQSVTAPRSISDRVRGRGTVKELLIANYALTRPTRRAPMPHERSARRSPKKRLARTPKEKA